MSLHLDIDSLLKTPLEARDQEWEKAFLYILPQQKFQILEETPKQGPDGFPYLMVGIDSEGTESAAKVFDWLSDKGIGLVVNPFGEMPDYVLTYGQIWNYKERNEINSYPNVNDNAQEGQFKIEPGQKVHTGEPSEDYLPNYVRKILRDFFQQQGMNDIRINMISVDTDSADKKHYDLCFSLESLNNPKSTDHRDLLEAISWFLPSHYSLALMSEEGLPDFTDL